MARQYSDVSRVVGARIREIRNDVGISQVDLAALATLHVANLGKIERGLCNPSLATLARIATALDTTTADLVKDVTPEHVPEPDRQVTAAELLAARAEQGKRKRYRW